MGISIFPSILGTLSAPKYDQITLLNHCITLPGRNKLNWLVESCNYPVTSHVSWVTCHSPATHTWDNTAAPWLPGFLAHWLTGSLAHWIIGSLAHWLTGSLARLTGSPLAHHSLTGSLSNSLTSSLAHGLNGSLDQWLTGSLCSSLDHWLTSFFDNCTGLLAFMESQLLHQL